MDERRQRVERRKQMRSQSSPTLDEIRAVFHRIWTSQVGQEGYSKRDWRTLRQMIFLKTTLSL